jgi:hypothetical protein
MLVALLLLPVVHYIADFRLQNDWMALGKSKEWLPLLAHVGVYAGCFALIFGPTFGLVTLVTHLPVDYVTSRMGSKLFPFFQNYRGDWLVRPTRHRFFCMLGLDQMIHQYTLILSVLILDTRVIWI